MTARNSWLAGVATVAALAVTAAMAPGAPAAGGTTSSAPSASAVQSTESARHAGDITSKVRGTFGRNGTVRGTFEPQQFFHKGGEVYAAGTLNAVLRNGKGEVIGRDSKQIQIPIRTGSAQRTTQATCEILHLVLGPLDLNLLGLKVHLDKVVLTITAEPGPGNLLGNLLCEVAGLLDGTRLIELLRLANLLNRILAILAR